MSKQERAIKLGVGIATVIFLFWFLRESQIVTEAMRPSAEAGKLGNPVAAGALAMLMEIGVAIGGAVILVLTGLWKWAGDLVSPLFDTDQQPKGLTGEELVEKVLNENPMSAERRMMLEHALIAAVELQDPVKVAKIAELLAGTPFFKRTTGAK